MPRTINALNTHTVGAIENGRSLSNRTAGTELVITLISYGPVDELRLMADPLVLGGGKRHFEAVGTLKRPCFTGSQPTTTGAIVATYSLHASPQ